MGMQVCTEEQIQAIDEILREMGQETAKRIAAIVRDPVNVAVVAYLPDQKIRVMHNWQSQRQYREALQKLADTWWSD